MADRSIEIKRIVRVPRERLFAALTQASRLREWLSDWAWAESRPGGRYLLRWRDGFRAEGTFVEWDEPEGATWVWQGVGDPGPTLVEWELEEEGDATEVDLEHRGFGAGPRWDAAFREAEKAWSAALDNLRSVLEEGVDLRELRRPFLGVILEGMDAERAAREGIAVETGVYVADLVSGCAAEKGGIQKGDVIVSLAGRPIEAFEDVTAVLQTLNLGDTVEVGLVRGREHLTAEVTLAEREPPAIPDDPAEVAARLREQHARFNATLAEMLSGLTEVEAEQRPAEGEWSVKEVLAHLSIVEREMQAYYAQIALGLQVEGEANPTVWPEWIAAVLAAEPTVQALLDRFARDQEETALLIEHLSDETRADRYRCRRILESALRYTSHTEGHIEQIRSAIAAVRG